MSRGVTMRQTPLIDRHRAHQAKLVDFAGWEMPIQYASTLDEYHAVRSKAGLFDVSHMGRLCITGRGSAAYLQRITTNDVMKLAFGQAHYSMICNEHGGIKDDVFVYRTADSEYLLCVNASNREKILGWLNAHHRGEDDCRIEDRSSALAQIAIQGPASRAIVRRLGGTSIADLKMHRACDSALGGIPCFAARTGYTGELGYEIVVSTMQAGRLWDALLDVGHGDGLIPAGLGARDLLRLEMGYLLYGNDIGEETTPLEANVEWTVNFDKGEFIGRGALEVQKQAGPGRRFVAFQLVEKAVPRRGFPILDGKANRIGEVTSGNFSPILQKGIGLGYVSAVFAIPGTTVAVDIRGKTLQAVIVKPPFYKRATK